MNDMTLFLDLILLASGAYCMYTFLRLAVTKRLFKNGLLVPKEKKISDCADEAEYAGGKLRVIPAHLDGQVDQIAAAQDVHQLAPVIKIVFLLRSARRGRSWNGDRRR